MKSIIIKTAAVLTVGLFTAASAAFADTSQGNSENPSAMSKVEHGTAKVEHGTARVAKETWHGSKHMARDTVSGSKRVARDTASGSKRIADKTWMESKKVARTVVHSPAIAYDDITGKNSTRTASRTERRREQIALTGHRKAEMTPASNRSVQPAGPMQGRSTDMNRQQQNASPATQRKSAPPPI